MRTKIMKKVSLFGIMCVMLFAMAFTINTYADETEDVQQKQPVLKSIKVKNASSIQINWKVDGNCQGCYIVYRKNGTSKYKPIAYIMAKNKTSMSYTDTSVVSKIKYTYTVQAIDSKYIQNMTNGTGTEYSNGYIYHTVNWDKPYEGTVAKYLLFADDEYVTTLSNSKRSFTFSYPESYNISYAGVYALMKGTWGEYDKKGLSAKTSLSTSKVTSTKLVATKKLKITWTKSKGATGYKIYRRSKGSSTWKKLKTIKGDSQLYCYDSTVSAKKTYYYMVRSYVSNGSNTYIAPGSKTGKKAYYKNVTVKAKSGDFSTGSVYGPRLSKSQLSDVKKAVQKFMDKYITSDMTNLEKAITAQLYMARYCTYAADYSKNGANTAWGSLVYKNSYGIHEGQCSGFARGYKALCDGMGVPCRYVHANDKASNPSHQWTEVKVDGKWYIVDPQCNATSGYMAAFLIGTNYEKMFGMKWDKGSYPTVSTKDYSGTKIDKACNGYKVMMVYNKLFSK